MTFAKEFVCEIWTSGHSKASPVMKAVHNVLMVVITGSPKSNVSFLTAAEDIRFKKL